MEKCIIDLLCAVTQIDRRYYSAIGTRVDRTQYPQETEASFTAELFHRFKNIIEMPINCNYYDNLILHYDITKAAINGRPDLVLHQSQENTNVQKMFIEVKTSSNVNLEDDFQKLITATESFLNFENAIIIIANRKFDLTKQLVSSYFRQVDYNIKKKLFLINAEMQEDSPIEYNLFQFSSIRIQQ